MPLQKKSIQKGIDMLKKLDIKDMKSDLKGTILKIILFLQKNKSNVKYLIPVAVLAAGLAIFLGVRTILLVHNLNIKSNDLLYLDQYNTSMLKLNEIAGKDLENMKTIEDVLNYNTEVEDEVGRYEKYMKSLETPYTNLMQYLYLPRLNIWKNPFLGTIDTNLIGKKYLENNPYNDILLLQEWSDFFKFVGENNETNTISNITIGDISERNDGFFKIPISVDFVAHSKRSFLLLVDKLSLSSDETNIGLSNEFAYYLWQEIKSEKQAEIDKLFAEQSNTEAFLDENGEKNIDKMIGFHLYQWINDESENSLIDTELLLQTVNNIVACDLENQEKCLYEFREKYRTVPRLAYLFYPQVGIDPVENFKKFLQDLPPVLEIKSFSFDKVTSNQNLQNQTQYEGKITIDIYGKAISEGEVEEISLELGKQCFGEEIRMTAEVSKNILAQVAEESAANNKIDALQSSSLWELNDIMDDIIANYPRATNYDKIIYLFEIYRMMDGVNLCQ